MIGLVISRPAAVKVAGVTPLSNTHVRWFQASTIFKAYDPVMKAMFLLMAVAAKTLIIMAVVTGELAILPPAVLLSWIFYRTAYRMFVKPSAYAPQWRVADLVGYYFYDAWTRYRHIPVEAAQIAERVRAIGLTPKVEYFDEDPFLFVTVEGKRVYLYHWD
jgi:hypothetical protein